MYFIHLVSVCYVYIQINETDMKSVTIIVNLKPIFWDVTYNV